MAEVVYAGMTAAELESQAAIIQARGYLSDAQKALGRPAAREATLRDIDRAIGRLVTAYCVLRQS